MKIHTIGLMCLLVVGLADAGTLELNKQWIKQHMNQATSGKITFHIVEAKDKVNPISSGGDDGDLHIAGSSAQVGLPMVAEIINARKSPQAVSFAQDNPGKDIAMNGVWRIWFEHPPTGKQKQFANNPITGFKTNPDHMFEIHPISVLDNLDLLANLTRVEGYEAKPNVATFKDYETKMIDSWKVTSDSVIIESKRAGHNYADFVIRLKESPKEIKKNEDKPGRYMAQAEVLDNDCSEIMSKGKAVVSGPRRMVFVEQDAKKVVGSAKMGATFHVMGIPRVNLERLTFYLNHPDQFNDKKVALPYEMIIIAAESKTCKKVP
ncbi:MAG: hypothetical protein LAO09_22625 [Acidobacteriia bacterium]|nr:hypothetical protein [Terriglobia bacterium]